MPTINRNMYHRPATPNASYVKEEQSQKYYGSMAWRNLRDYFITNHPLCQDCALKGRSVPAEEIHHVVPFLLGKNEMEKWRLLLDMNNLVSLCKECHIERHRVLNKTK